MLGRDKIYEAMKQALETPLADVLTRNEVEDIRFLRPDVALVSCIKHVSDEREPSSKGPNEPLQEQGRWLIASAQTTPIRS